MTSMTLYVDRHSILHRLDPLTKLLYVFVCIAITFIYPNLYFALSIMAISLLLLVIGRVFIRILPIIAISLLLIISIIIVQGIFHPQNETVFFTIASVSFYKEGLSYAALLTSRVINMISAFAVLILTTKPDELVDRLLRKGLPPKLGYIFLSIFQLIPQMQATMGKITDAQRSRGMETEGNLLTRIKAFLPLIGPLVLNALNDTKERSLAIEMRGFNSKRKRSFIREEQTYTHSVFLNFLLLAVLMITILWRVFA